MRISSLTAVPRHVYRRAAVSDEAARGSDEAARGSDEAARGSNKPACRNEATPSANAMFLTNEDFDETQLP